jgi:hypothetical protein
MPEIDAPGKRSLTDYFFFGDMAASSSKAPVRTPSA